MSIKRKLRTMIGDYYRQHQCRPPRIAVSQEIARELDVETTIEAEEFDYRDIPEERKRLYEGHVMWFQGIPVVADLRPEDVLNVS